PERDIDDYSLWYYSIYRSSIAADMQQKARRHTASKTPEGRFGQVPQETRTRRGLTQEELAHQSGYHPTYISQLERGKKSPSLRTLLNLASILKTPASELVKRVEGILELKSSRT